jgi:chromosome segregation ATPase
MLEDLLSKLPLEPVPVIVCAGIAVGCLLLGWICKAIGANRKLGQLRKEALEAKRAVPQLESSVHNRDLQIARFKLEAEDLTARNEELSTQLSTTNKELRSARREARNLNTELKAIKGHQSSLDNEVIAGFEEEDPLASADDQLKARMGRVESLYQARNGNAAGGALLDDSDRDWTESTQELTEKVSSQEGLIESLRAQIRKMQTEKEMLADMAKRRSDSNRALKEASAEAEAHVPVLRARLEERDRAIAENEAAISVLRDEVDMLRAQNAALEFESSGNVAADQPPVEDIFAIRKLLEDEFEAREEAFEKRLREAEQAKEIAEADLALALAEQSKRVEEATSRIESLEAELGERRESTDVFKSVAEDRELKLATLTNRVRVLLAAVNGDTATEHERLVELIRQLDPGHVQGPVPESSGTSDANGNGPARAVKQAPPLPMRRAPRRPLRVIETRPESPPAPRGSRRAEVGRVLSALRPARSSVVPMRRRGRMRR